MRVVAGRAKGTRLEVPAGDTVRPTSDRLRERLFAVLEPWVPGARVLDLFAGSGALGIEALSRGAARAVLADRSGPAVAAIRANLKRCELGDAEVIRSGWRRALEKLAGEGETFDLVFLDPPYAFERLARVLVALGDAGILAPGALVAVERPAEDEVPLPDDWERGRVLGAGGTRMLLCRPREGRR